MKAFNLILFFSFFFCGFSESASGNKQGKAGLITEYITLPLPPVPMDATPGNSPSAEIPGRKGPVSSELKSLSGKVYEPDRVKETTLTANDPKNKKPKAHAGRYQDLKDEDGNGKESVQLDGSESKDQDGRIVSYSWTIEGTGKELAKGVNPVVEFQVGSTWLVLTVTDDGGLTDSEKVKIKVKEGDRNGGGNGEKKDGDDKDKDDKDKDEKDKDDGGKGNDDKDNDDKDNDDKDNEDKDKDKDDDDKDEGDNDDDDDKEEDEEEEEPLNTAPVADAGADQQLNDADKDGKEKVRLDGSKSRDKDGSIVAYSWSLAGKVIAEGQNPEVGFKTGTHTVQLTVTDNGGLTATDETEIKVSTPASKAPEARAGADQELTDTDRNGKEPVKLDGSSSNDPDGIILSYSWQVNGNEIATGENPAVDLPVGTTTVVLIVEDNEGITATDEVKITIREAENQAPVAHAGENQNLTTADGAGIPEVKLDGSGSTDSDGEIVSYSWSLAGAEIAGGREPVIPLAPGNHTIILTVTDNEGATDTDETNIIIEKEESEEKPANQAPVAHAGADQELTDMDSNGKETVQLNGTASTDEEGSIAAYSWSIEGSETVLATGVSPLIDLSIGSHALLLSVTDDGGLTDTDTVVILIKKNEETAEVPEEEEEAGEEGEGEEGEGEGEGDGGGSGSGAGEDTEEEPQEEDAVGGGEAGTAFLPNLFSPNGDQMNDEFTLEATHVEEVHLRIYNRQGRLVYESLEVEEATKTGWDGNAFGEPQPAGTYVWILEGSYKDGSPILIEGEVKGNITLIR